MSCRCGNCLLAVPPLVPEGPLACDDPGADELMLSFSARFPAGSRRRRPGDVEGRCRGCGAAIHWPAGPRAALGLEYCSWCARMRCFLPLGRA